MSHGRGREWLCQHRCPRRWLRSISFNKQLPVWEDFDNLRNKTFDSQCVPSPKLALPTSILANFEQPELRDDVHPSEQLAYRVLLIEEKFLALRGCDVDRRCCDADDAFVAKQVDLPLLSDGGVGGGRSKTRRGVGEDALYDDGTREEGTKEKGLLYEQDDYGFYSPQQALQVTISGEEDFLQPCD